MRLALTIWLALSALAAPPLFRAQNIPAASGAFSPSDLPDLALPDLGAIHGVVIQKAVPGRRKLTRFY